MGNILCIQSRRDYIIAVKEEYKRGWTMVGVPGGVSAGS